MLYGFAAKDVARIRQMVAAYERGRVRIDAPSHLPSAKHQQDSFLGYVGTAIASGDLGTAVYVDLDESNPPVQSQDAILPAITVYNPYTDTLPIGVYLVVREPSEGYYVPTYLPPGTTQNGLISEGPTPPITWDFSGLGTIPAATLSLALPGKTTDYFFVNFGAIVRMYFSVGATQHRVQAELSMTLAGSGLGGNLIINNQPVAILQSAYNWFDNANAIEASGNCVYATGPNDLRLPQSKNVSAIMPGNQTTTLTFNFTGNVQPAGLTPSWGGTIDLAWIQAFQISPLATVGGGNTNGTGGGGGGTGVDDDSGYLPINGVIDCGSWV